MDAIARLCELLKDANLSLTFDPERNNQGPCMICGKRPEPGSAHTLIKWRTYTDPEDIRAKGPDEVRPVCVQDIETWNRYAEHTGRELWVNYYEVEV